MNSNCTIGALSQVANCESNIVDDNNFQMFDPFNDVTRNSLHYASINQSIQIDTPAFEKRCSLTLPRRSELITNLSLSVELPEIRSEYFNLGARVCWTRRIGFALLKEYSLHLGGLNVESHSGLWLNVLYELCSHNVLDDQYRNTLGDDVSEPVLYENADQRVLIPAKKLLIPLKNWFSNSLSQAYFVAGGLNTEVKLDFTFERLSKLLIYTGTKPTFLSNTIPNVHLLYDEIYLSEHLKKDYVKTRIPSTKLIELVSCSSKVIVNYNQNNTMIEDTIGLQSHSYPAKEMIWLLRLGVFTNGQNNSDGNRFLTYTNSSYKDRYAWDKALNYAAANIISGMIWWSDGFPVQNQQLQVPNDFSGVQINSDEFNSVTLKSGQYFEFRLLNGSAPSCYASNSQSCSYISSCNSTTKCDFEPSNDPNSTMPVTFYLRCSNALLLTKAYDLSSKIKSAKITIVRYPTQNAQTSGFSTTLSDANTKIIVSNIVHNLTIEDISIPLCDAYYDGRYNHSLTPCNPITSYCRPNLNPCVTITKSPLYYNVSDFNVTQFFNFGTNLDGTGNPIYESHFTTSHPRFKESGQMTNYAYPNRYHNVTPCDGLNLYTFNSGTPDDCNKICGIMNFSKIENPKLTVKIQDPVRVNNAQIGHPKQDLRDSELFVFLRCYNKIKYNSNQTSKLAFV
jgi:hypothetical protein